MMNHKPVFGVLAAGVAALLLAGCGGTSTPATDAPATATPATVVSSGPATVSAAHNAADITFAQQMIPHHQQAVAMAQLAADRAANGEVKQLAARIQGAQAAFDRAFLQMMTAHHQGAIQMAQTELADGQNPEAKGLAQKIITAQQGEITQMRTLPGS